MRAAWSACAERVASQATECGPLLLLSAIVGQATDHENLVKAAAKPELRRDAIWALGFAGRRDGADVCVELIAQELQSLKEYFRTTEQQLPLLAANANQQLLQQLVLALALQL